uniref:LRRCT domain-containing protein n=1 Tax=Panagrolaimus davidi TaxID=227884 RepID=A0A914Q4D7_9BILA
MAWLINDYNTTTPLYVNNLKNQWSDESSKNELFCTNPPELKNEYLYKLSGDFCLNETLEAEKEEEIVYEVCRGNENEEIVTLVDESDSCECKDENLKCTLLETTNVEIINKTIEIKFIQINQANISKLNLKNMIPEKQHLIESLQFYHSNIGSIENGTFDNFTSLKTLDFHGNVLTTIDENALTKQLGSALLELDLTFNNLKNLSSTSFMFLTKLKILKLQGNYGISNSLTSEVFSKSLSSLEHLILSHCNITALKDDVFVNLKNLKFLGLSDNPITTFPSAAINSLSNLQVLEMDGTKITVLKHTGLKRNTNLRYLFAHASELLQKIENCAFCSFPNLISADFSHSKNLTSIHENAFGLAHSHLITALQSFYVNDCNLTTLPEKLLNWTSLKGFSAKKNPFKCDCSNKWLIKLAKSMKLLHYQCQSPVDLKGKHFMELPDSFCNETVVNTTTLNSEISTTTLATITVTEAASTFSTHRYWMLVLIILSVVLSLSIVGGYYYYNRKRRIIQIPKSNEGDEDLLEEDFDMY